jgi:hypothetical protein
VGVEGWEMKKKEEEHLEWTLALLNFIPIDSPLTPLQGGSTNLLNESL